MWVMIECYTQAKNLCWYFDSIRKQNCVVNEMKMEHEWLTRQLQSKLQNQGLDFQREEYKFK